MSDGKTPYDPEHYAERRRLLDRQRDIDREAEEEADRILRGERDGDLHSSKSPALSARDVEALGLAATAVPALSARPPRTRMELLRARLDDEKRAVADEVREGTVSRRADPASYLRQKRVEDRDRLFDLVSPERRCAACGECKPGSQQLLFAWSGSVLELPSVESLQRHGLVVLCRGCKRSLPGARVLDREEARKKLRAINSRA